MSSLNRSLNIALLLGGPGAEREVSLVSGEAVYKALCQAGFTNVTKIDVTDADFQLPPGTELAYNIIHGTFGEDGTLQSILEKRGIPYTGAGSRSSALCFDKAKTKKAFVEANVPTPKAELLDCSAGLVMPTIPLPFVIKPPCEGSSVGVHICHKQEDVLPAMEEALTHSSEVLVEEFIQGKELTVGILNGEALPVIHICPRSGFYDLSNKYPWMNMGGGTDYICPAELPDEVAKQVQEAALQAYHAAKVEVYARVDVLLRESDNAPFVLEINTIPGMTPSSLLPKAAAAVGWSYEALCEKIAELSLATPR
ncbi:MAG: D-alanine--D-alanine ligase [Akkermansia sp.]|nr:D-alanine--D-alanine ligase [Akkermansia sp.]